MVLVLVSLTISICCERLLLTLTISDGGPLQWNCHHLLDFIIEGGLELMERCVSGVTGINLIYLRKHIIRK